MLDTVIEASEPSVVTSTILEVAPSIATVVVNDSTSKIVEVIPNNFVLSSGGAYGAGFSGSNIPIWLQNAIQDELATGTASIAGLIGDLQVFTGSLAIGINQNLARVQTAETSISTLETSVVARIEDNQATVYTALATKATPEYVQASLTDLIASEFGGDTSAWALQNISTYADANLATAQDMSGLYTVVTDLDTGLSAISTATDLLFTKTGIDPVTGALGATSGYFQELYAEVGDNAASITTVENVAATAYTWSAKSVKNLKGADGSNMGFQLISAGNTGTPSTAERSFTVVADTFKIVNPASVTWDSVNEVYNIPAGARAPFSVNSTTNEVTFNGVVSFTNVTNAPTIPDSTSDLVNDSGFTNLATVAAQGYVLPAGVANAINTNTTTINGSKITTGSVSAAVLSATAIYGKTINITDTSASGGIMPSGTSSLGYFDTSRDKNALGAVNRTSGGYAISGISTNTASSVGVHGVGHWGVLGEAAGGGFGFYTTSSCYFEGANYPFTGSHLGFTTNNTKLEIGDIVIVVDAYNIEVNNSVFNVLPSSLHNDKKVIGVFNGFTGDIETFTKNSKSLANNETFYPLIDSIKDSHKIVGLNALGEGGINVCNEGGNIEIGDYICSSSNKGKGMKQDDDLLHNYTVAKALEGIDWSKETATTKMIACTYHCG